MLPSVTSTVRSVRILYRLATRAIHVDITAPSYHPAPYQRFVIFGPMYTTL
jgi:hypothetical protein